MEIGWFGVGAEGTPRGILPVVGAQGVAKDVNVHATSLVFYGLQYSITLQVSFAHQK